jgi:hypothetical protein
MHSSCAEKAIFKQYYNFNHVFKGEGETDPAIWIFIHNKEDGLAEETTYEECYLYFMQNLMNMVIQSIKQLEAEYTTLTEIYDIMLSVKKGLKDHIKDKFYGFKVGQALKKLSITEKKKFETAAIKVYLKEWFDFKNSPFRTFSCLSLQEEVTFDQWRLTVTNCMKN